MLAGTVEQMVMGMNIVDCCCCLDQRVGVAFLGLIWAGLATLTMAFILLWSWHLQDVCYGPIFIPEDVKCFVNLNASDSFQYELIKISDYMVVSCKVSELFTVCSALVIFRVSKCDS